MLNKKASYFYDAFNFIKFIKLSKTKGPVRN